MKSVPDLPGPALRLLALGTGASMLLLSACVHRAPVPPPEPVTPEKKAPAPLFEWSGEGRAVSHMHINVDEQKARFFSGKHQIGWATVASGVRKFPTPVGDYKVLEKTADKKSNLYGKIYSKSGKIINSDAKIGRDPIPEGGRFEGAKMSYYLRLTGDGIGLHAGPIPNPGSRASHGCIRLPRSFAPLLFASVAVGTPVTISGDGPGYAAYIKAQNAAAARLAAARAKKKAESAPNTDAAPGTALAAPAESAPPAAPAAAPLEIKPAVPASGAPVQP